MQKRLAFPAARSLALLCLVLLAAPAGAASADELIRRIDRLWRGDTSEARMTMTVKTERYERR